MALICAHALVGPFHTDAGLSHVTCSGQWDKNTHLLSHLAFHVLSQTLVTVMRNACAEGTCNMYP